VNTLTAPIARPRSRVPKAPTRIAIEFEKSIAAPSA
jgi:hypothetical protein